MESLAKLQLVSKVCVELENHIGSSDKILAEYLIELAKDKNSLQAFHVDIKKAAGSGPSLPEALIASIFRAVSQSGRKRSGRKWRERGEDPELYKDRSLANGDDAKSRARKKQEKADRIAALYPALAANNAKKLVAGRENELKSSVSEADDGFLGSGIDKEAILDSTQVEFEEHERGRPRKRVRYPDSYAERRNRESASLRARREVEHHLGRRHFDVQRRESLTSGTDALREGSIHRGRVENIKDFGAFVAFGSYDGLVHVSRLRSGPRVDHPSQVVSRGQDVFVKILSVSYSPLRISLSMRDVDQRTGKDLQRDDVKWSKSSSMSRSYKRLRRGNDREHENGFESVSGIPSAFRDTSEGGLKGSGRARRKIPETEQWELTQLANSGVLSLKEMRKQTGRVHSDDEGEDGDLGGHWDEAEEPVEEIEIELNESEPAFLRLGNGDDQQGPLRAQPLSPVRIVKNPDGSMQRAAMTQSALAKERRELRDKERQAMENSLPGDLNRAWEDPVSTIKDRHVAAELRGAGATPYQVPEWKKKAMGTAPSFGFAKKSNMSVKEQRESLPIFKLREELLDAFSNNQVLIVIGETGSGKTTQITQYLLEAGYAKEGRIGCTQPRRVAAMSVAKRVAEERGSRLGEEIGYAIRFEDVTSAETRIKYMTDGILLREALVDEDFRSYSVIMLDEAHERKLSTDVLFGLLKSCVKRRRDLKLIVTSATLNAEKFSSFFFNCPIFTIPGRTFPVEIMYSISPESDYLDASLMTVLQIHLTEPPGDILLFLTGQEEIDTAASILFSRVQSLGSDVPDLIILPVYSALPSEMQTRVFEPAPPGSRKAVIATNIAEASLTIDGIIYVVDPGFAKQKVYNPKLGMDALIVAPISQASARQRAGRAGRTAPGKCYRLYTEEAYRNEMLPTSVPEIQSSNLANTVLILKAQGINDLIHFDFMDPPPTPHLIAAMESLYSLGALDDEGLLTRLGRTMTEFPLEPMLSKVLLASVDLGCSDEILTIVSMLSVQSIFHRPREKQAQADQKKSRFHQPEGDHVTLLAVYQAWERARFSSAWCYENFIQPRSLQRAQDIRNQLITIMDRYRLPIVSCGNNWVKIRRAIVSGFFVHAAKRDPQEGYRTLVEGQPVFIHPNSSLFHVVPTWVIYHEVVHTTKEYMREVLAVESKWLVEMAPRFFKVADHGKLSRRKRKEKIEPLFDKYAQNQNDWRLSRRRRH